MYWHKNDWSECIQSKEIFSSRHLRHFIWCNILFSLFLNSCFFFHTYSFHAIEWVYSSECPKITFEFEQRVKNFSWFAVFQIFDFVGLLLLLTDWELRVFSWIRIFVFWNFRYRWFCTIFSSLPDPTLCECLSACLAYFLFLLVYYFSVSVGVIFNHRNPFWRDVITLKFISHKIWLLRFCPPSKIVDFFLWRPTQFICVCNY